MEDSSDNQIEIINKCSLQNATGAPPGPAVAPSSSQAGPATTKEQS